MLQDTDAKVSEILEHERERQEHSLEMIPSENFVSRAVLETNGSVMTNKYSEGYSHKRYYGGNEFVDEVEDLAIERAKEFFKVEHVNVQPYSGSPANLAVYLAVMEKDDKFMGMNLMDGGHLTHGWKVAAPAMIWKSIPYHVRPDGLLDMEEVRRLAIEHKPRLIWCGITAYTREVPFEEFGKIADEVGAYLVADIAHISGLVGTGVHPSPVPHVHLMTTTTHKTLRGPRGGMIMVTKKGLEKDPDLSKRIDRAVFPGLQGGPHDHTTAAMAVALSEALRPGFKEYCEQIVKNCQALGGALKEREVKLVTGGSDNHMQLIDLTPFGPGKGIFLQEGLDLAGITVNKNTVPADPASPFYPSGVRLGTPALTTRGMKEPEMVTIGHWIADVIDDVKDFGMPDDRTERKEAIAAFRESVDKIARIKEIRQEVKELTKRFPLYPGLSYR